MGSWTKALVTAVVLLGALTACGGPQQGGETVTAGPEMAAADAALAPPATSPPATSPSVTSAPDPAPLASAPDSASAAEAEESTPDLGTEGTRRTTTTTVSSAALASGAALDPNGMPASCAVLMHTITEQTPFRRDIVLLETGEVVATSVDGAPWAPANWRARCP